MPVRTSEYAQMLAVSEWLKLVMSIVHCSSTFSAANPGFGNFLLGRHEALNYGIAILNYLCTYI